MYSILLLTVLHNHGIMERRRNLHVRFDIADIKYTVLILFAPEPIHLFFSFESFVADTGCFTMQEPCKGYWAKTAPSWTCLFKWSWRVVVANSRYTNLPPTKILLVHHECHIS